MSLPLSTHHSRSPYLISTFYGSKEDGNTAKVRDSNITESLECGAPANSALDPTRNKIGAPGHITKGYVPEAVSEV